MKTQILIAGVVGVGLLAGGGGGYFIMGDKPKPVTAEAVVAAVPPVALPVFSYVKLEPLHVSQTPADGKSFRMMLTLVLEVANPNQVASIEKLVPKLRDAFIRELHGRPLGRNRNWEPNDFEIVKQRLLTQADTILGPGLVSNVLVQQAMRLGG